MARYKNTPSTRKPGVIHDITTYICQGRSAHDTYEAIRAFPVGALSNCTGNTAIVAIALHVIYVRSHVNSSENKRARKWAVETLTVVLARLIRAFEHRIISVASITIGCTALLHD